MNPKLDTQPGLHLPQPTQVMPSNPMAPGQGIASAAGSQEAAPVQGAAYAYAPMPAAPLPATPPVDPAHANGVSADPLQAHQDALPSADTSDTLDEEWITKAKDAVERYQADPYNQSRELGRIKAEYLKARYNKEIKIGKDSA